MIDLMPKKSGKKKQAFVKSRKRQHRTLTITQKVELLEKLEAGMPVRHLCLLYGIGSSTVYDAKRQRNEIIQLYENSENKEILATRKKIKEEDNFNVEKELLKWFRLNWNGRVPISGEMIMTKARILHQEMNPQYQCEYSQGWLQKFKARHGFKISRGAYVMETEEDQSSTSATLHIVGLPKENIGFQVNGCPDSEHSNGSNGNIIISPTDPEIVTMIQCDSRPMDELMAQYHKNDEDLTETSDPEVMCNEETCTEEGIPLITKLIECLEKSSLFSELEIMILYMMQERLVNNKTQGKSKEQS